MKIKRWVVWACLVGGGFMLQAQTAEFTYQGHLRSSGQAANGPFDFQFQLRSASNGPIVGTVTRSNVFVTNGLFTVPLGFADGAFDGSDRWLHVHVALPGSGSFTALNPPQRITATPYALHARSASNAQSVAWSAITGRPTGLDDGDQNTSYSAGAGLTLSGTQFSVNFAGTGASTDVARADHHHFGAIWSGTATGGAAGLRVQNNGTAGSGIEGRTSAEAGGGQHAGVRGFSTALSGGVGVLGESQSGNLGVGVFGAAHNGTGIGVLGYTVSSANGATALHGHAAGASGQTFGAYVEASSPDGIALAAQHTATNGSAPAVRALNLSTSPNAAAVIADLTAQNLGTNSAAVRATILSTSSNGTALVGIHRGTGRGVAGQSASGVGVYGRGITGVHGFAEPGFLSQGVLAYGFYGVVAEGTDTGVYGHGEYIGLHGTSAQGYGVHGRGSLSNGVGVAAFGNGSNTALLVSSGAIRVQGAGPGTATPAFIHVARATNTSGHLTYLDNRFCNGDRSALLLVTPNWTAGEVYNARPIGLYFDPGANRWAIFNQDFGAMPVGVAFNVLVIKP
jgi:hypothetical protein